MAYGDDYEQVITALTKIEFVWSALEAGADMNGAAASGASFILQEAEDAIREAVERMCAPTNEGEE